MKKGAVTELRIETAAYEGKGIGRVEDRACFVKNTAPGDLARIRIIKKRKNFFEGQLLEVLEEGPERVKPVCRHAETCGGCTWQHVSYEEQLRFKRQHVEDHMQRIGGLKSLIPEATLPAPEQLYYRNKMEYSFGDRRWLTRAEIESGVEFDDKDVAAGMHAPGRFDRILNLEECHLQIPVSYQLLDFVRSYALEHDISSYNPRQKTGFLRNLMIRNGRHTGDLMVNIVSSADDDATISALSDALLEHFPAITTITNNINDTPSPSSEGRYQKVIYGPGYIEELIGGNRFKIGPNTFFQTNTLQAEALYETAKKFAALQPDDLVFDLYCGVGSLTFFVADAVKKAVGIELNPVSVDNAVENAEINGITNCAFETGDMKDVFTQTFIEKYGRPDVIITDPPRAGMHPDVVQTLKELAVERLVYVSCNSATMARDLAELSEVYEIGTVQPVDMFPQTYHIETVAALRRKPD
jgi:23S rRNA (uracil1939-C5)-methyltransferase